MVGKHKHKFLKTKILGLKFTKNISEILRQKLKHEKIKKYFFSKQNNAIQTGQVGYSEHYSRVPPSNAGQAANVGGWLDVRTSSSRGRAMVIEGMLAPAKFSQGSV